MVGTAPPPILLRSILPQYFYDKALYARSCLGRGVATNHEQGQADGQDAGLQPDNVVVVCQVTVLVIGHGILKKFWPMVIRLRPTNCREFHYLKLCRPALTSL